VCVCVRVCDQVDVKTTALAMAITDSELSDEEASILESGGFSVSRATTPQLTDVSEGNRPVIDPAFYGTNPMVGVVGRKGFGGAAVGGEGVVGTFTRFMSALWGRQ